ncbi:MAG: hypothetical protein Q9224_005396 [Gallowayella concinna]
MNTYRSRMMEEELKVLPTEIECHRAALKAFDDVMDRSEANLNIIRDAEQRIMSSQVGLNARQVDEIKKEYGETFKGCAKQLESAVEKFMVGEFLPALSAAKPPTLVRVDNHERLVQVALWKFLEKVWFPASDYDVEERALLKAPVQYWRAQLYQINQKEEEVGELNDRVRDFVCDNMPSV